MSDRVHVLMACGRHMLAVSCTHSICMLAREEGVSIHCINACLAGIISWSNQDG